MTWNRATTPEKKREIIEQLLVIWESKPELRLAQMIANVLGESQQYRIEDTDFIDVIYSYYLQEDK